MFFQSFVCQICDRFLYFVCRNVEIMYCLLCGMKYKMYQSKFKDPNTLFFLNRNQSSEGIKIPGAVDVDMLKEL